MCKSDILSLSLSNGHSRKQASLDTYFEEFPKLKLVADYIKSNGINSKQSCNDKILLVDFSVTGNTFNFLSKILTEYCGINPSNIEECNIMPYIRSAIDSINRSHTSANYDSERICRDLYREKIENFSNTPHFDVYFNKDNEYDFKNSVSAGNKSRDEIFDAFRNLSQPYARAFQLVVLDELNTLLK